jgi:hypothetical protein
VGQKLSTVSAYDPKNINEQLDKSTKSYLMTDAKYDKTKYFVCTFIDELV